MLSTTPFEFPPYLLEKTKALKPARMAVAGADHPVALESAKLATQAGFIEPVLVGDPERIRKIAHDIEWNVAPFRAVSAADEKKAAEAAVALAAGGEVQALMKGHVHTDALMRAVIAKEGGLRTDRRTSHVFHMTVPGNPRVLMITDGAVNVNPTLAVKMDILKNAVDLARALGNPAPHVAVLSGAEVVNPSMPSSVDAAELVKHAMNGAVEGAVVDGPLGFDNAISPEAARLKGIDSPVAGRADILLVPNLEAGNFLFKQMVYFMSATAAGVVMGAKVPIVLTSRADPPEARSAAAAIAAIVAAGKN